MSGYINNAGYESEENIANSCCFPSLGLKHVSDKDKTHKNPNLRSQATPVKTKSAGSASTPKAAAQKRPPLLDLEGKKWRVVRGLFAFIIMYHYPSIFATDC